MGFNRLQHSGLHLKRFTGNRGTLIQMHHSLRNITLSNASILAIFLLPIFFDMFIWQNLDIIMGLWEDIFSYFIKSMELKGRVFYTDFSILGHIIYVPFPDLETTMPSQQMVWINVLVCVGIFILSFIIPQSFLPVAYFIRALTLIQFSASGYFFLHPNNFPYEMGDYMSGTLALGIYFLLLIPPLLGMIFYIFDFSLFKKIFVTLLILSYFILFLPFQYMLHALIIHRGTLLFMPVLYLNFSLILDSLMFIGWYSWAMSGNQPNDNHD